MATLLEQLPEDWATRGAEEKVQFFNEKNWTPEQLLGAGAGLTQSDIDWMRQNAGYTVGLSSPSTPSTSIVDRFTGDSDYSQQDLIADTTSAPVNQFTYGDVTLPSDWYGKTAGQKVQFFNEQNLTPEQLLGAGAGLTQADIDWMRSHGYTAGLPTATSDLPDFSNMINPFTGERFGDMDPALLVQAENEQKTLKNLTDQLLAGWQGLGENVGIGSAGTPDAEIGGRKLQFVAEDFAKKLQQQGITDLSQAKFNPGAQAAWTAEGHGNVSLMATSDGRLVPVWGSSSDAGKARQLALAIGAALVAPGLSTALGGGIAGGAGAGAILGGGQAAIAGGDLEDILKGAFTGGLGGGITAGAGSFANSVGADVLASTGSQVLADAATAAVRAGAGALPRAITTGDFGNVLTAALTAGATSGATSGVSQITGLSTKDINAAINFAQGAASGDLSKMLSSASAFTNNPDIEVASKAVQLVQAIESGDPSRIVSAGQAFGKELDGYNTRQTIEKAYQDPTRILDTITGSKVRDAGARTVAGVEDLVTSDLTTQDLIDIINPPGQVATAAPAVQTTPPTTAEATTTTTTAPTQGPYDKYVDFGEAFRAARSELGSGKQFTWTNPVTGATQTYTTDLAPTQVAQVTAGGGRGIAPGATAADAAALSKISLRQEPAASTAQTATVADEPIYDALGNLVGGSTISGEAPAWFDPANKVLSNVVQQGFSNLMQAAGGQAKDFGGAAAALGIAGPDNALIRAGSAMEKAGEGIELQSVKQATQNVITAVRDADGYGEKIIAGVKAIIDNPSSANVAAREVFQEILPIGAASRVAKTAGLLAAAGVDTALNAAESMGSSYNDSYAKAIKDGKTPEQADAQATKDGFIAGAITTLVGGAVDLAVVKKLSNVVEKVTGKVATSSGKEFGSEGAEEFLIAIATGNDLNTALTKSVIGSFVGAKTTADVDVVSHIDAALNTELKNAGLNITTDANGKVSITDTGKPSSDVKTEPSFDPTYVVATDPDTGDAITLGELTGSTLSSAGTSTRIDPTLEALGGEDLDSQQIINDYVNEVLGGNAPSVSASTANVVVGTDPETGADVTLGDLGLTGPTTKAPVATGVTAPATTAPSTTTAPDTAIASDASVAAAPAATVGTDTKTTTDPNTGATTTTATDPNTGTETTTTTDPNTGTETNTATDPNTGSTTTTQTDPNANTSTTTKTDPNTNTSTSTTTDANTNTSTTTNTDANTNTTTSVETNQNTGVTTNTSTTPDTNTTTTSDPNTNTTTTSDTNTQTGVTTQTVVDANTNTSTTTKTDPNTNTSTTTESNPNTGTDTTTTTDPNTNTTTTTETNTNTGTSTTTTVDTTTGEVVDTNVEVPPVLPPGEDVLPPVTEEELRTIVAGPPLAPTPAPPAPTPALTPAPTPAPTPRPTPTPTPAPSPLAQLPPAQQAAVAQLLQEIFQAPEADLLEMFAELSEEREQKRKERGAQMKSRKA